MEIIECIQGSDEWYAARLGIPTSSMFHMILAKGAGKTRKACMRRLAKEQISGEPTIGFYSQDMMRGHELEGSARDIYRFRTDQLVTQVGFIKNHGAGSSPDALVGSDGGLEIKTKRPDLLESIISARKVPSEFVAQIQGNMWVSERSWWDLFVFYPGIPYFIKRVERDDAYIKILAKEIRKFRDELTELVEHMREEKNDG